MLFKACVMLVTALITGFLIPWLNSMVDANKMAKIKEYTEIWVRCAEQSFNEKDFEVKKSFVMSKITEKLHEFNVDMTETDVEALVESTVNLVKYGSEYTRGTK